MMTLRGQEGGARGENCRRRERRELQEAREARTGVLMRADARWLDEVRPPQDISS